MTLKNSIKTLSYVLQGIKNLQYDKKNIKLVFVDGGSTDDSLRVLEEFKIQNINDYKAIQIISGNYDITEGRNICIHNAEGEFILFVDSDVVVPPDLLIKVEHLFSSDSKIAFINIPCVVEKNKEGWIDKFYESIGEPLGMSCAAIRLSMLQEVGPYFIGFPKGGENPNELIFRLEKAGYKKVFCEKNALHIKQKSRGLWHYLKSSFYSSTLHHFQEIKGGNRVILVKYFYYISLLFSLLFVWLTPYPLILLGTVGVIYYLKKSRGDPIVLPALIVGMVLPIGLFIWVFKSKEWEEKYRKPKY